MDSLPKKHGEVELSSLLSDNGENSPTHWKDRNDLTKWWSAVEIVCLYAYIF